MSDNETPPIKVTENTPLEDQIVSAIRATVLALTAFALGREWIQNDLAVLITALLGVGLPILLGQMKTRHRAKQLVTIGSDERVPDAVIQVSPTTK